MSAREPDGMAYTTANGSVIRQIESLFEGGSVAGMTDRQLLERFGARRDPVGEAAFAAIVTRHGPMVLNLCRSILGDLHHAEDAFQAVFLVLARRAGSVRDPDLLGNWLYGVAIRTARCAKLQIDRQRKNEERSAMRRAGPGSMTMVEQPVLAREDMEALHDAIARLPRPFRLPVVLCYFEGLTLDEAAKRLRWPAGTLRSRLARARDKLRNGLTRRGAALPAAMLAAGSSPRSASASVSSSLCDNTTKAAIQFAAGQAASDFLAASIAREVLKAMFVNTLKLIATTLLLIAAVATGAGFLAHSLAVTDEPKKTRAASQPPMAAKPNDPVPGPGRMFVVGRVLDPQGKPVRNAKVMVQARVKRSGIAVGVEGMSPVVIGHAVADGSGQFRVEAPRTSSSGNDEFMAVALAPGYGVGWAEPDPDADRPKAEIRLKPEQIIEGRLFDVQGRPARGVTVSVARILRILIPESAGPDRMRRRFEGPLYWWAQLNDLPAWPKPAVTDADGRFTMHGVGRGLQATLSITDSRFAMQTILVDTDSSPQPKSVSMALRPAQIIAGRVTYADTGKPVPHASLLFRSRDEAQRGGVPTWFQTDGDGRFRVNPAPGVEFTVFASPPAGQRYLDATKTIKWPKGAIEHSLDLSLTAQPRGVLIRGKVTEQGSNHPVPGATVVFVPHVLRRAGDDSDIPASESKTLADGSFEVAGAPRPGHLVVLASDPGYQLQEIGNREISAGQPGGTRLHAHAFIACNPKPGGAGLDLHVSLRRGVTVTGRILAPDDQSVDTWIISRIALKPIMGAWYVWWGNTHGNTRNGRFELRGLDPDSDLPVHFFEPNRQLGATVHLSGKSAAGGELTVRLQPCGMAKARLVDPAGKPVAGYKDQYLIGMKVTPGPERGSSDPADEKRLVADADYLIRIDSVNYRKEPTSDAQGRIVFPALIPGASYYITTATRVRQESQPPLHKNFTVKPGETLDLGDIVIDKPRSL